MMKANSITEKEISIMSDNFFLSIKIFFLYSICGFKFYVSLTKLMNCQFLCLRKENTIRIHY